MKIFVSGTRGIPGIPGGVETHCKELYPRIAAASHEVYLATRSPYVASSEKEWRGVMLLRCFAPRKKNLEAIVHTFIALLQAIPLRPDVVHIHAIGPSLLAPLAKIMGAKVVITHHGPNYYHQKWGGFAKCVLRLGEIIGTFFADEVIAVSETVRDGILQRRNRQSNLIRNGVVVPQKTDEITFLNKMGIKRNSYLLAVGRYVPEKGLHDLIDAFQYLQTDHKLVIAGEADHESDYSRKLREAAANDERIILTGYITGKPLAQVYTHAALFVLPSYHEGLPIALLEAMSYGLSVLASDIPANMEVGLSKNRYFRCGDVEHLKSKIELLLGKGLSETDKRAMVNMIQEKYDWDKIAEQTIEVYEKAMSDK
ncbi:MAG: glycosyltransferase family 4 protein [Deltaproteobacteria bacterium]|nr:glycosyltransferase family 4 protein [Deltaproteobacteria bacterium]